MAVADEMSVSGAANRIGTSQPVISRTIKRLEDEFNAVLFDRLPRGVALSPFGKVLYHQSQTMLASHKRAIEEMRVLRGDGRSAVRIGAGATWLEGRLPGILAEFATAHPEIAVDAEYIPRYQVAEALLLGRIDIGLAQYGVEPLSSDDVAYEELLKDRLIVLGRHGHPLTGRLAGAGPRPDYAPIAWAITPSATGEERLRGLCRRYELGEPAIQIRCHSMSNVLQIVRQTDLLTLAPDFFANIAGDSGLEIVSSQVSVTLSKGILTPKNASLSLASRIFRTHLRGV